MSSGCDSLDNSKHERVVQALEQVNGFRYRYKPAPQEGKKMLRFDSDEDDGSDAEDDDEASSGDESQRQLRQRAKKDRAKQRSNESEATVLTLDDRIENLLRKTRTLAMLKIANNTASFVPSDSEDDSDEADDVVSEELASMQLARTLSAFLCLPRAISYVDLEAITEKLLGAPDDQLDDEDYADLIDCHVDSARDDESHGQVEEEEAPIWKRRHSKPVRPLTLPEDPTDLELHQRHIFMEANRFGGASTRNMFLASSRHLLTKDGSKGSMYLGMSASGRLLGSNVSSSSLSFGRQDSSILASSPSSDGGPSNPFNEEEYIMWRTQVKADYLAWLNAKVEATKRRKSRVKKVDPNKKPRWLLLYEASLNPTSKYNPDAKS
ncbi:hypothetical protein PHYBOEH_003178 [Phytophthora boehmeriae]|uniref:Uncharacterized protein n=1 Tax=Phytophthora boehmeriae TaxID=109152 RepID=A0A8T1WVW9_9STRA|nr:hypothetical protein PHYBOEH_003178 [Phytophthora boehmeriae]